MKKMNSTHDMIKLTPSQAAWLKMIAPANVHARYNELREQNGLEAISKDDDNDYKNFIRGKSPRSRDFADLVFQAYGVTSEIVSAIETLGLKVVGAKRAVNRDNLFFKECGDILWRGTDTSCNESLLSLMDSTLYLKGKLTDEQQRIVLGQLLDYLLETRDYKRWSRWMIAASFESNTNVLSYLRANRNANWEFPQGVIQMGIGDDSEINVERLTKKQLDACGFFVRRFNMRINEIRHQNYEEQRKFFDEMDVSGFADNEALRKNKLHLLRECFKWARGKILPFWKRMIEVKNPNRWYFLACGARLIYDWAIWNSFSVKDKDVRESCKVFHEIFKLARRASAELAQNPPERTGGSNEAARDQYREELELKCRLHYLASVSCRHLAESASRKVWADSTEEHGAGYFAQQAVEQAKQAHSLWDEYWKGEDVNNGVCRALRYRFARNVARQLTFLARWWLMHPTSNGQKPRMHVAIPEYFGIDALKEASVYCRDSICASRGMHEMSSRRLVLKGKPLLEYEFYLRTWIEQLTFFSHVKISEICKDNGEDPYRWAMTCFCQIMLIYIHLFIEAQSVDKESVINDPRYEDPTYKVKYLALRDEIEYWLKSYKYIDADFDETELADTMQQNPPSVKESRFETICAIKYEAATRRRLKVSALWRALNDIEGKVRCGLSKEKWAKEFVAQIWMKAKHYLEADLKQTVERIQKLGNEFIAKNSLGKEVPLDIKVNNWKECWNGYPPFAVRKPLVFEPGSNSDFVDLLMSENGLDWGCVREYYDAIQSEEDK